MKISYFKIGQAIESVKTEFRYGNILDKAGSIAKLAGKTVANAGLLAVEAGSEILKNMPEHTGRIANNFLEKNPNLSDEQRDKLNATVEAGKVHQKERYAKETADRKKIEEKERKASMDR